MTTARANTTLLYDVHVLIVDDHEDALEVFEAALRHCGAKVLKARNAADALTIIKSARVDAIVSDLAMPENDGLWLVQQIRRLPRPGGGSIPAVAVTAYSSHYDTTRIAEGGFEIVLTKPVDPFQLSSTIAFLVGR